MQKVKRYVFHSGYVNSKVDGDRHFISARQVANLFKLPFSGPYMISAESQSYREQAGDLHLYPSYHGNYKLPLKIGDIYEG